MKEKLEAMLKNKLEQRKTLDNALIESEEKEERKQVKNAIDNLDIEIKDMQEILKKWDEPKQEERKQFTHLGSVSMRKENENIYNTVEYRTAFKNYLVSGEMVEEFRGVTKTSSTNVSAVIPENLVNQIIEKYEQLGTIYNLVTKTSYPVGQTIPVDGVKPVATWVGEGYGSTAQEKTLGASITFTHHKLRCEIRYTQEVETMTLAQFEALFVKQVGEAMLRALEASIVDGNGTTQPKGILLETAPTGQAIEVADGSKLTYKLLCDVEGCVPANYESTAKWVMSKKTFMSFMSMTDTDGQSIARVNYGLNGKVDRYLLGREVVIYTPQAGSRLGTYADSVATDTIFAFIFDFGDYALNTNYDLGIKHAQDWDNEDHKTKSVLACDGKVIVKDSLVTLTKKAAAK